MSFVNTTERWQAAGAVLEPLGIRLHGVPTASPHTASEVELELPDGTRLVALVNTSERWEFLPEGRDRQMVIQTYVNPRMAQRYRDRGVFYADLSGNSWIWTDAVKIFVAGRPRPRPEQPGRPPVALGTPSELRFLFVLLNDPSTIDCPLRAQADMAGVSLGAAQKARQALRRQGWVTPEATELRRLDELPDIWLAGFVSRLLPRLRARQVSGASPVDVLEAIDRDTLDFTPAGEAVSHSMSSRSSLAVYGTPPWTDLVRATRLKTDPSGPLTLRERFWNPAASNSASGARPCSPVESCSPPPTNGSGTPRRPCGGTCREPPQSATSCGGHRRPREDTGKRC